MFSPTTLIVMLLVLVPAALRLMDFQWNIACIGALSMFCGLYIRQRWLAITIPLAAMVLSDIGLGIFNHDLAKYTMDPLRPIVYIAYLVMISLGISVRRYWQHTNSERPNNSPVATSKPAWQRYVPVAGATLAGSLLFFFATNFGVWVLNDFYPHTWEGLTSCFAAGIPFYRTTLASDMVFTLILVGGYELFVKSYVPVTSASRVLYAE